MSFSSTTLRFALAVLGVALGLLCGGAPVIAAETAELRPYRIPAGDAKDTLRLFAEQSGEQIVYLIDNVRGQRTRSINGRYAAAEALERMLLDTRLRLRRDDATGAMTVVRRASPPLLERLRPSRNNARPAEAAADEVIELSAFTVSVHAADRYRVPDAISAVRVRAPLINTPSSISVITRDTIDDVSPTRLFDVTRYIAGIEDGRGIQFADRQIIRGFESNGRTVDNFLQSGADNYDEALVERIEISKGPNAILSPAGVPGGSINVITKSPSFTPRRSVTGIVGLFDAQKVTFDATGPLGTSVPMAYRLVASAQDTRRYWGDDVRLRRKALAPMLTWRLSERTQLTLKAIATELWIFREPALIVDPAVGLGTPRPYLAPGFSAKGRNGTPPWSHVGTHIVDGYALLTTTFNENVSLRLAANVRRYFEDSTQQFLQTPSLINRYHPATGLLTPDHVWMVDAATRQYSSTYSPLYDPASIPARGDTQETTLTSYTVQNDLVLSTRGEHVTSQTVAGWALSDSRQVGRLWRGAVAPINLYAPAARTAPEWETAPYADHRTLLRNWQVYANQRLGLFDERLLLTGGLMYYDVNTSFRNHVGENANRLNVLDDAQPMWLGSVLLRPHDRVSAYYSYSTNSSPTVVNDQPIWRDGQQHEVGLKTEWFGQRLAVNVAWFRITQSNVSVPNPERQTNLEAPEHLLADLGDHGVELEIAGGLTENLSILAAHTELRLRDYLGRRVRAVADRNSALLLYYRFRDGRLDNLSLTLGLTRAGERMGDTTPVDFTPLGIVTQPSFKIPAYTIVNVGAAYRWQHYCWRINIDNVLDDAGYLQQAGGRVSGTGISTAPGLNVKFSMTVEF